MNKAAQMCIMVRSLGRRLRKSFGLNTSSFPELSPRLTAMEKVSRNALLELVGRAKSHPQRGEKNSANPAYVALNELAEEIMRPDLALGLRHETGEISFLDFAEKVDKNEDSGDAFVDRAENLALWRRLEKLIYKRVDSTMVGPRKAVRVPEEVEI